MAISTDKLNILASHYEESFQKTQEARKARDGAFTKALILLLFVCFDVYSPGEFGKIATSYLISTIGITGIDLRYVSTVVWLFLMILSIRYFQLNVNLDRQYDYLHEIEAMLSSNFPDPAFTREGRSYLKSYPVFSDWIHYVYTVGIPVMLLAVSVIRLVGITRTWPWSPFQYVDTAITIIFITSIITYAITVHFPKKSA
jgi:hypothetical protein